METMTRLNILRRELFWRKTYATFVFFLATEMAQAVEISCEGKDAFLSHDTVAVDDLAT